MTTAIRNEWLKLFGQPKAIILAIILWISALLVSIGNLYMSSRTGFTAVDPDQMPITMITILGGLLLPLVVFIMAVDSTSLEYRSGTIRYGLMAPITRGQLFASKAIALILYNGLLLAGVLIITAVTNVFGMTEGILLNLLRFIAAYGIALVPLTLVSMWGMAFGTYFSMGLSLGLGIAGIMALNVGQILFPVLGSVSPMGYMDLSSQVVYGNTTFVSMSAVLLYIAAYFIILIGLNIYRLQTKEI